jgi:fructuronate reductase
MKLTDTLLTEPSSVSLKNIKIPQFDKTQLKKETLHTPQWLHLGAGNIFRAFLATHHQQLLNQGEAETGIIVAEGYDYEIVDILQEYDGLTVNVLLRNDGSVEQEIVGSIVEYLKMDPQTNDFDRLTEIFCAPSLQMVSLTITEKGYSIANANGEYFPAVSSDFENGPSKAISYLGKLVGLLYQRYLAGAVPVALVSMDNMSHNGEQLQQAVLTYAEKWLENNQVSPEFVAYLKEKVTYPWTMIDKITPRPSSIIQHQLEEAGLEDMAPSETEKHSFVAPYVNGEETEYLIIEDQFPNGRPKLEKTGIQFTNRKTVNQVETMKVTTCLNPLHTCLAIFGCLLNYSEIFREMEDEDLKEMVKILGYQEGLPVVIDPKIINPKQFLDEVIEKRLPNIFIPDTPQRIATDTSQKLAVRFGETLKSYMKSDHLEVNDLKVIPLVLAGWLRYLTGINDAGETFKISPDPLLTKLQLPLEFEFNDTELDPQLLALLNDRKIFGVDLAAIDLADKVIALYKEMATGPGAIRRTIQRVVKEKK